MAFPFSHPRPDPRAVPRVPAIDGQWRQICRMPDLGELAGAEPGRQHIVDHSFVRAADGSWHLWACLRGTRVGRLICGWEGTSLEQGPWAPAGVKARADAAFGEPTSPAETIGAPFFYREGGTYYCFYHADGIRLMTSTDGKNYTRRRDERGTNVLACPAGRDTMIFKEDGLYHLYSCITTASPDGCRRNFVSLVVSRDMREWSDYIIVSEGGVGGNGPVSAESPFVVKVDGLYYLFRASSISFQTYVYRSATPFHFGVNDDSKLIAMLPIKAPEILLVDGKYYISDLADFQGIRLARLRWDAAAP
ncbi:MAG: hypothetical protein HZA50_07735 [Planctomycetes bacterium]|nr:hypothetical protein [Planctomycetota bacterium]